MGIIQEVCILKLYLSIEEDSAKDAPKVRED